MFFRDYKGLFDFSGKAQKKKSLHPKFAKDIGLPPWLMHLFAVCNAGAFLHLFGMKKHRKNWDFLDMFIFFQYVFICFLFTV